MAFAPVAPALPGRPGVGPDSEPGHVLAYSSEPAVNNTKDMGLGVEVDREEALILAEDSVLLSPGGDVPLHLAVSNVADLARLANPGASPRPRLSAAQRGVGLPGGTVLLLGRSGTGKTVCLCERMVVDRERALALGGGIRQLFVARSARMCELVRGIQVILSGWDA